jgi:hypothetical protein
MLPFLRWTFQTPYPQYFINTLGFSRAFHVEIPQ